MTLFLLYHISNYPAFLFIATLVDALLKGRKMYGV